MTGRARVALRLLTTLGAAVVLGVALHRWAGVAPRAVHLDALLASLRAPASWPRTVRLARPGALAGFALLPWFVLFARTTLSDLAPVQRALSLAARTTLFAALLAALALPSVPRDGADVCTVFLVDVSDSVTPEALAGFHVAVSAALSAKGAASARVVLFARRPVALALPGRVDATHPLPPFDPALAGPRDGTDLAAAMTMALGLLPADAVRRVVVLSDGVQTRGDVLAEADRAARFGVRVSVVLPRGAPPAEVALREVRLPETLRLDEPFDVHVSVYATTPAHVTVTLRQGDAPNGLDGARDVDVPAGSTDLVLRSIVRAPGDVTYTARVVPAGPDRFATNNRAAATATVPGRPSVLVVAGDPARMQWLRAALAGASFDVDVRAAAGVPRSLAELERFDFVVLADVAAESVGAAAQDALGRYVRDLGGGFLMAGGARGFGLGGWQGTALERLLPVRMDGERRRDEPAVALALVIDRSGSMQGAPLLLAQSAAGAAARALAPDDLLEVVAFDVEPDRVLRLQAARNRARIDDALRRLRTGGGTAIFPALEAAQQDLSLARASTRHVILLTDGQGQPDEPPRLRALVEAMSADGITVSTVGLGTTVDRELLQALAHGGHGRSYFTADPQNLPQIFLRETTEVARNAAVEAPVQPRVVGSAGFLREAQGTLPLLYGYVSTRAKPAPAQVLVETDGGEPLLARVRAGLGWALAWTSDLEARWAADWVRWPRFQAFWAQAVREHMRARRRDDAGLEATMEDDEARIVLDAVRDDDGFDDGLDVEAFVRGPWPSTAERSVMLRQVGPGRYEATLPVPGYGSYTVRGVHRRDGAVVGTSRGRLVHPYPLEYARMAPDTEVLTALARVTGGVVDPAPSAMFDSGGETVRHDEPAWRWPAGAAVALLLIDLLLRRVRLADRDFRAAR